MSAAATSSTASTAGLFARGPRATYTYADARWLGLPATAYDLPHPKIEPQVMLVIHHALIVAFEILRQQQKLQAEDLEDDVTDLLLGVLENDLRYRKQRGAADAIPGFDDTLIESITRHMGTTNYKGDKIKKEPDLYFKLRPPEGARVVPTHYAIFVECKPVTQVHSAGSDYCDAGLIRFVEGDYAWAMQESLMIGYVRDKRSISKHLRQAITSRQQKLGMAAGMPLLKEVHGTAYPLTEALHVSEHGRAFPWLENKGPACPIRVYHSWHDCS